MTGMGDVSDTGGFEKRTGVGVRISATELLVYDLVVLTRDVNDAVTSAGGWLCDRVRAGWRVTVLAPPNSDLRPLQILGVGVSYFDGEIEFLSETGPAAIAAAADILRDDVRVRDEILRIIQRGNVELTLWGDVGSFGADARFGPVAHRLSDAARAFKNHALVSASIPTLSVGVTEEFRSCAVWYPPDGADLMPVG
jgi:hypothetical protein